MAVRHMVFGKFAVTIDGTVMHAELWGERIDAHRHSLRRSKSKAPRIRPCES